MCARQILACSGWKPLVSEAGASSTAVATAQASTDTGCHNTHVPILRPVSPRSFNLLSTSRSTRCIPASYLETGDGRNDLTLPCTTCARLEVPCTFFAGYRKPGRPRREPVMPAPLPPDATTSGHDAPLAQSHTARDSASPRHAQDPLSLSYDHFWEEVIRLDEAPASSPTHPPIFLDDKHQAFAAGVSTRPLYPTPAVGDTDTTSLHGIIPVLSPAASTQRGRLGTEMSRLKQIPITSGIRLDDVIPWSTISEFLTIFLRYLHSLFPLVHKPSFAQALALRLDHSDRNFGAFVLGLVAYTIGQCPLSRLTTGGYSREELRWIQHRCHEASLAIVDRRYDTLSVNQVGTLMTGYFYCQSTGKTNRAVALLAEACQITQLLCSKAEQDENVDFIETQLRRRLFWHVYAVDTTEASAGHMIHLNAFDNDMPLPLDVEDELITGQGAFPQLPNSYSTMHGFIACIRLFPILADTIARRRQYQYRVSHDRPLSDIEAEIETLWVAGARRDVDGILKGLPPTLKDLNEALKLDEVNRAITGMQRANILVTETSLQFALFDYISDLEGQSQASADERSTIARTAFSMLSGIPLEDMAANGESMRGKVFRIILDLLSGDNPDEKWVNALQDWWTLYSCIQFVQLMPVEFGSCFASRQVTPDPIGV